MKWIVVLLALMPVLAIAAPVPGLDDTGKDIILSPEQEKIFDDAFTSYYQAPSVEKVNIILDSMNNTELLRKKTAWSPVVGFLSVVFANNKNHVFAWMSRNDYNSQAQEAFVDGLLLAELKESALVFAQAHHWSKEDMDRLNEHEEAIDLKHMQVMLPGHLDTLWGAFFASGNAVYVNQVIETMFRDYVGFSDEIKPPVLDYDVVGENKKLAETTLRLYAQSQPVVCEIIRKRIHKEKDKKKRDKLQSLLP